MRIYIYIFCELKYHTKKESLNFINISYIYIYIYR